MALKFNRKCLAPSKTRTCLNYTAIRISAHKGRGREQWQVIHIFGALILNARLNIQHTVFNSKYVKNVGIFTTLQTAMWLRQGLTVLASGTCQTCPSSNILSSTPLTVGGGKWEHLKVKQVLTRSFKTTIRAMNLLSPTEVLKYME